MSLLTNYRRQPVTLVRGDGCWVEDVDGMRYLDLVAGIAVNALGHAHPRLLESVERQMHQLLHTSNLYGNPVGEALAARLCELSGMSGAFFCNSGTEANEAAFKLARKFWSRSGSPERAEILYATGSFHGRTYGALAATDNDAYREGFGPLPAGYSRIEFNAFAGLEAIDAKTAAVIVEPVQGESGVHVASAAWLRALRARCDATGALLIFDEVQCGLGRTGSIFAFQQFGVVPDALTLAKSLGGGLPLGALLVCERLREAFQPGDHGSTFGGNPVACAAALTFLDVLVDEDLPRRAFERGVYFKRALRSLASRHPTLVGEVRVVGLMMAVDVVSPLRADEVVRAALAARLLITTAGGNALRMLPALVISETEIDEAVSRLDTALAGVPVGA